jgi:aspartyl-tRNA(Asn)/glutamyl-tRNA(Gln) amidotransferase subunit A
MLADILWLGITELAGKLKALEISPVDVVESCLSRIEEMNPRLNAFVTVTANEARRAAKRDEDEIRTGRYRGSLHGIPLAIKDIVDTAGVRTTYGSAIFRDNVPERDAVVVSRLKEAGAIVLGKTNTHEFALGVTTNNAHYGATRNPWAPDRIPGGSSGGSAAAVASFMCYGAVGTDTGGSIRIPSAFCGLTGLKPTYGRVSTTGVFPLASGLDHVGPITRSAIDAAIMLQAMAGFDPTDPRSLNSPVPEFIQDLGEPVSGAKIAVSSDLIPEAMDPEVESAYKAAISKIEDIGGKILETRVKTSHLIEQVSTRLLLAEAAAQHAELLRKHSDMYGANIIDRFRAGQKITTTEYIGALRDNDQIRRETELIFEDVDFLLTPSVQILPPKIGEDKVMIGTKELDIIPCCVRFTRLANITGIPAIVLPYGYSRSGLPLSIQLMAPRLHEKELLRFSYALERATPKLRGRKPQ